MRSIRLLSQARPVLGSSVKPLVPRARSYASKSKYQFQPTEMRGELPTANVNTVRRLLGAVQAQKQEAAWNAYVSLDDSGHLACIPTEYHSLALQTFRLNKHNYTPTNAEIETVKNRLFYVLERIKSLQLSPDIRDYNHLLSFFSRIGDIHTCDTLLADLRHRGLQASAYTYTFYMQAALQANRPQQVFDIYREMEAAQVRPITLTYNILISAHGQSQQAKSAFSLFSRTFSPINQLSPSPHSAALTPKPDAASFAALINSQGPTGDLAMLDDIYTRLMPLYNVKPTVSVFNALIRWHVEAKDMSTARRLFFDMEARDVKPNLATFNHFLKHEAKSKEKGGKGRVKQLMEVMGNLYGQESVPLHPTTVPSGARV